MEVSPLHLSSLAWEHEVKAKPTSSPSKHGLGDETMFTVKYALRILGNLPYLHLSWLGKIHLQSLLHFLFSHYTKDIQV